VKFYIRESNVGLLFKKVVEKGRSWLQDKTRALDLLDEDEEREERRKRSVQKEARHLEEALTKAEAAEKVFLVYLTAAGLKSVC